MSGLPERDTDMFLYCEKQYFNHKICAYNSQMNNISTIQLFVRVVEEGSFSSAARFLGLTPSAVSRQISHLEKELGGRLFQRTTRKQRLTEAGEIYFQHAQRLVEDLEVAKLAVKQLTDKPSGSLRITAEADFALTFIEPILPEFLTRYPEIQVNLQMSASFQDLINTNLDLAIRIGHLEDSSLAARKLADSQSVVCASPAYIAKHGMPNHPSDLIQHSCLSFRTKPGKNYWRFETPEGSTEIPISGRLNANGLHFLRQTALNGLGIIMIPTWMVRDELNQQTLVPLLTRFSVIPSSTPINAIFSNKRQLAPKVRAFVDFLAERIQTL